MGGCSGRSFFFFLFFCGDMTDIVCYRERRSLEKDFLGGEGGGWADGLKSVAKMFS